ncbi:MAG: ABC transporter substrate-binding protein [Oscillospiraceae bacterium]|nr:ABC transporter substrate-binding protein [Oscillospiraceae bacterium]
MKKLLSILLVVCMCMVLVAACAPQSGGVSDVVPPAVSPGAEPGAIQPGGVEPPAAGANLAEHLEIQLDGNNIAVISPFQLAATTAPTQWIFTMIYDRLIYNPRLWDPTDTSGFQGQLATSWETEDYQTFIFHLREGVYFHNGDRFTADDVVFTAITGRNSPGTLGFDRWRGVDTIRAIDTYTVEIVLSEVNVDFLFEMGMHAAGIVNERAMTEDPENGAWVGAGPFMVTDFATSDFVTLTRFDDYWGEAPPTQSMTFRFVPEVGTRLIMMLNHESDLSFGVGAEDLAVLNADPGFFLIPTTFNTPNVLGFNMQHPITGDLNFRRAVGHAINSAEIAMAAASEWAAEVTDGAIWGYAQEFRNNDIPALPFDLDLARQYLEASPYNGEEIEISTAVITNIRAAEAVQMQLAEIGINITINAMDTGSFTAYATYENNQAQMYIFGAVVTLSSGSVRNVFYPFGAANRMSFNDPYVSELIDRAMTISDPSERAAIYRHLQEHVAETRPAFNIFWRLNAAAAVNGVGGVRLSADWPSTNLRGVFKELP